jgi:hypothetical protein
MKFVHKSLALLLASLALASCGGGGGDGNSFTSPPQPGSITLTPAGGSTTLPLNVGGANPFFPGSPYTNEVDIHWTNADGSPVSGHDLSCSVTNLSIISIHVLDDASTPDDESAVNWGNIQVHSDTGHAQCWVYSTGQAGQATLNVGGVDPNTGATVSKSVTFTVQNASAALPASVTMTSDPPGVYFSGSNGNQSSTLTITVLDGGQQPVPNPTSGNGGADNVLLEVVTNPAGGARLSANSVAGPVSGTSVATHTVNGIATASFQSGDVQGPIQIRATSDRSDNNVTNGIADAVSTTFSVIVSDGKLDTIDLTTPGVAPNLPAIVINSVSGDVTNNSGTIPPDPNGTLSLTITAKAQDRQGNPVLPGTALHFGSVDEPVGEPGTVNDNDFLISGTHGDPEEGGVHFTATDGAFTTAGGGAGPGDALVVFNHDEDGNEIQGNRDLVSAVTVQSINSATSLTVASPFNRNDTTGVLVNNGPVLPYLVGRAEHGSINASATTDDQGVANALLTYTVSSVGNSVAVWAQGDGIDRVTGGQRRVTSAGTMVYPGVAPATIVVTPLTMAANTSVQVTACVTDALGLSLRGLQVGFQYAFNGSGTGTVDGQSGPGVFAHKTDRTGCATGTATTSGVSGPSGGGDAGTLTISLAGQSVQIDITAPITHTLTVNVQPASQAIVAGTYSVALNSSAFSPPVGNASCSAIVTASGTPASQTCTYQVTEGATVALAEAGPSDFINWTDDCASGASATNTSVVVNGDVTCTANW